MSRMHEHGHGDRCYIASCLWSCADRRMCGLGSRRGVQLAVCCHGLPAVTCVGEIGLRGRGGRMLKGKHKGSSGALEESPCYLVMTKKCVKVVAGRQLIVYMCVTFGACV